MEELRDKIDKMDDLIMSLLIDRYIVVKEIGEYKKENNIPVLDKNREEKIYEKIDEAYLLEEHRNFLKSIYGKMMEETKNAQNDITVYE